MNYQLLQSELENETYQGLSATDCVALLNEQNITQSVDVPCKIALNNLAKAGVLDKLILAKNSENLPAQLYARLEVFLITIQNIDPLNFANFEADIPILVGAGIITQIEADNFLAMSKISVSRAETEFGRLLTENDVNRARWGEQVTAFKSVRDEILQQLATVDACIADLESGNAYHELDEVG